MKRVQALENENISLKSQVEDLLKDSVQCSEIPKDSETVKCDKWDIVAKTKQDHKCRLKKTRGLRR